jgi:hypothetical protein
MSPLRRRRSRENPAVLLPWFLRAAVSVLVLAILFSIVPIEQVWSNARRLPPLLWLFALSLFYWDIARRRPNGGC